MAGFALGAPVARAAAQAIDTVPVRAGARVRVSGAPMYQPLFVTARVARVREDSIWLRDEEGRYVHVYPQQQIGAIDVSLGKPVYRRRAAIGAMSGAAVAGGVVVAAAWIFGDARAREVSPLLAAYTVLPGAFIGAVVGVRGLEERWAPGRFPQRSSPR